ncbi:hypothetical protein ACQR7R_24000, partial [Klebsiella pneumoniae]
LLSQLAGKAHRDNSFAPDLDALRQLHPQLHTFAGWLAGPGRPAFERALTSGARWAFDR